MLTDQDIADLGGDQFDRGSADSRAQAPEASSVQAEVTAPPSWSDAAPSWPSWSTNAAPPPEVTADLPISGYDGLSLPSLRARLRSLGTAELRNLLAHERSHANRADVVTMFERRIAKLADGS